MEKKGEKSIKLIRLSKESQRKIQGGRVGNCDSWSCIGAMDAYVTSYYKRT